MFLSDHNIAEFKRRKYEKYMRENNPEAYAEIESNRNYLKKKMLSYKTEKQRNRTYLDFKGKVRNKINTYIYKKPNNNMGLRNNLSTLGRPKLPDLSQMRRKVDLLPPKNDPLPAFETLRKPLSIETKHGSGVANPVKNTFSTTSGRKPQSVVLTPKPKTPSAKDANKLLRTLGVAGVVSGGLLGAYGLKKYYENKKEKK